MPSMGAFLKPSRLSQQIDKRDIELHIGNTETKAHSSKRNFFRRLLKRSSVESKAPANRVQNVNTTVNTDSPSPERPLHSPNIEPPSSPHVNSNKPLPPPPLLGSNVEKPVAPKPQIKLDRIIAPLAVADLQKLFSGAPQYFASSEGNGAGVPHPSVAYPYDTELNIRDLTDYISIQDKSWNCATAWPHVARHDPEATIELDETHKAHFLPRCRERPSMLSMQGFERGTVGFQAALEFDVADALQDSEKGVSGDTKLISERRWKFLNGKDGARPLTDSALIERLLSVSERYHQDTGNEQPLAIELYTELFTQILHPPSRVTDADDPYSLHVQIEALVRVLGMEHVWFDFSKVEWRIRLGQILWGSAADVDYEEVEVNNPTAVLHEPTTQKYWLLLQVLLSSELLCRLDMVSNILVSGNQAVKPEEIQRFEKSATSSVRWSIMAARLWLENIRIQKTKSKPDIEEKPAAGWLASLTGNTQPEATAVTESIIDLKFEGRHQARQLRGLVNFARKISWPNADAIAAKVSANGIVIIETTGNTPVGTPKSVSTQRSSYFPNRPGVRRGLSSTNDRMSAIVHPTGWLSNSYISGLILPGESLSHFLMLTLLENDQEALAKLGEEANLYGGFIYKSKSFWSTSCVVGRVLAAGKGSTECMGWISSDILPRGVREEWVDIDVERANNFDSNKKERKPRILRKASIEQRGHILGGADISSVLPGDFILPSDKSTETTLSVRFVSLDLFTTEDSITTTPTKDTATPLSEKTQTSTAQQIKIYSAMMRFALQTDGANTREINLALTNDVYFLTAHPCVPSYSTVIHSPTSPTSPASNGYKTSEMSGHLLHKAFTFSRMSIGQVLATPASSAFSSILSPPQSPSAQHFSTHTTTSGIPKVLIIDCIDSAMDIIPYDASNEGDKVGTARKHASRFGNDLEMLGRALCSERGWNALVSRKGRGCLACAVREAGAVGWRVILRVA